MNDISPGERLASIRGRRGMTQEALAEASGVSLATIRNMEQGAAHRPRVPTLLKLAAALRVDTSTLMSPSQPEVPDPAPVEQWDDVRGALYQPLPPDAAPAGEDDVMAGLAQCIPHISANRYSQVRLLLPSLLREARLLGREGRAAQAAVYDSAAWTLTQTRQFADAEACARLAIDAAPDHGQTASAVATLIWGLLRQGRIAEASQLAEKWADDLEPAKMSRASNGALASWGKILLYVSNAAVRDNRPGAAEDALNLAGAAAQRIGRDIRIDASTTRTFGPGAVAMIRGESSVILGRPQEALDIAARVDVAALPHSQSASKRRHKLDVAAAHVMLARSARGRDDHRDEAVAVLSQLRAEAPEWLAQQRTARDVVSDFIGVWKRMPAPVVRDLASAVQLPL